MYKFTRICKNIYFIYLRALGTRIYMHSIMLTTSPSMCRVPQAQPLFGDIAFNGLRCEMSMEEVLRRAEETLNAVDASEISHDERIKTLSVYRTRNPFSDGLLMLHFAKPYPTWDPMYTRVGLTLRLQIYRTVLPN